MLVFTPLLPSGAFFNNFLLTIFMINLSIFYALDESSNIFKYKKIPDDINFAFLGAWNFKDEIFKKEKNFIKRGGKFISHVPYPKII